MSKKIYIGDAEIAGGDGKSAYQSWLDQGNVGTEAQFLASLKGADGKDGKDGAQGNTGSSVDYPYELVNNVTTDDATKGLSAAQGVVLDEKISQLGLKVDNLSTGKYYGFFANASALPTGTTAGYAYVGTSSPYTIYNWNGTAWTNSGVTVSNAPIPDEEDIDLNSDNQLQFADRTASASGMGYVILRKNKSFASQVTAANTIYEIRYNYDLGGASVVIRDNCILKFEGGALTNGSITGSYIISATSSCFKDMIAVDGYRNDTAYLHWFVDESSSAGAKTAAIQMLFDNSFCSRICLDLHNVQITAPITVNKGLEIYGLGVIQYSYNDLQTIITPSDNFDDSEFSSLFVWNDTYNLSRSSIHGLKFNGNFIVNHAITQNTTQKYISASVYKNYFLNFISAAVVLQGCENFSLEDNYCLNCGTLIWAAPFVHNPSNIFELSSRVNVTLNILQITGNYCVGLNVGLILYSGTNTVISNNSFGATSTYGLYVADNSGIINIEDNYFEGTGTGAFWVDSNGVSGSYNGDTMVAHLSTPHSGEMGENSVTGWGISISNIGFSGRIRPVIFINSQKAHSSYNIDNNFISIYKTRAAQTASAPGGGLSDTSLGLDTLLLLGDGIYNVSLTRVATRSSGTAFPRTFITVIGTQDAGLISDPTHRFVLTISSLPVPYINTDWFYITSPLNGSRTVKVLASPQGEHYVNPYTICNNSIGSRSYTNINLLTAEHKIYDNLPYWRFNPVSQSPYYGYISYLFPYAFFAKAKFIYIPILYEGTGNTVIRYFVSTITGTNRAVIFTSTDTQVGRTYGLFISPLMFSGTPDYIEIAMRPTADDTNLWVGPTFIYEMEGANLTLLNSDDLFGLPKDGTSSARPILTTTDIGHQYFDKTLQKVIVWNGTAWVNMDGSALS